MLVNLNPLKFFEKKFFIVGFEKKMNLQEAKQIFNTNAMQKETLDRLYERLIIANHPDRNGSPYIMQKVNEARKLLMSKIKQ